MKSRLYTSQQVRELDRRAIEDHGISGVALMERAGREAWGLLRSRWPRAVNIAVVCGAGNNGGDGYVLAECARRLDLSVTIVRVGELPGAGGAAHFAELWESASAQTVSAATATLAEIDLAGFDVIVDALLGTGLNRPLCGAFSDAVAAMNRCSVPVIALDVPSGLNADSGALMGAAVVAATTVTFIARKAGLYTGEGPAHCGDIEFADLGVPPEIYNDMPAVAELMQASGFQQLTTPRRATADKGNFGHVLVIGGDRGLAGAARMAAEAALRAGAGLVSLATRAEHAASVVAQRPEIMVNAVEQRSDLAALMNKATVIAIGPGLSRGDWGKRLLSQILESDLPKVVDADALNLLAEEPSYDDAWVLTPHPGEASRLLDVSTKSVQADRFKAAGQIQARYGGVCVLKGSGTLIAGHGASVGVSATGNPGMASGGMGDLLTGIIAGLIAQNIDAETAARFGAWLHGRAGDMAARDGGQRGMLASDLLPFVRLLVNDPCASIVSA